MSVTVGGRDPVSGRGPVSPGLRRAVGLLAVVLAVGLYVVLGSQPTLEVEAVPTTVAGVTGIATGRWVAIGTHGTDPFDVRQLGDYFVYLTDDGHGVERIGPDGRARVTTFGPEATTARITSDDSIAVVHGLHQGRPAIWVSSDGESWKRRILPWRGAVLAVAIRPEGLLVLGYDAGRDRQVVASEFDHGWAVRATLGPPSGLWSTGYGILGRDRLPDGTPGYVHTTDGQTWSPIGRQLSLHVGDVATIEGEGRGQVLRLPETGETLRPPEWPVRALWETGSRIWLQTPSAVWWSTDGDRWSPLRLTSELGVEFGSPVLLPFEDRALISVGGARGSARRLFVWILGS